MPLTGLAGPRLAWTHVPAGPEGFSRAPVLIEGPTEAILIDGGFTFSAGRAVAAAIAATGKRPTRSMSASRTRTIPSG